MAPRKAAPPSRTARAKRSRPDRRATGGNESPTARPGLSFPVVAIGASAGGLAAFTALLKALPSKSGMAFVLIQHLEPKHESVLSNLLSKATSMPVVEVSDGLTVVPNHVYVIPPNKNMTIRKGNLRLTPRSEASGCNDRLTSSRSLWRRNRAMPPSALSSQGRDRTARMD